MPLTFASLKSQRFRWCFGGMQILRRHWRELMPWTRDPENHLSLAQRWDYLIGSLQWLNDLVYLGFSIVLLTTGTLLLTKRHVGIRPLLGAVVLLPVALVGSGLLRAVWALRVRTGIGMRRALRAFANWLSLSWTVSLACLQGLLRTKGAFLRTPKTADRRTVLGAIWAARSETLLALALWCTGVAVGLHGRGATPFVVGLFAYQGAAYATSPYMSWLNSRSRLSDELERRRRSERSREERIVTGVRVAGGVAGVAGLVALVAVMLLGGSHPGTPRDPFKVQQQAPAPQVGGPVPGATTPTPTSTPSPSPSPSPTTSPTSSPTASPTTSPTSSPTASPSGSPSPSPSQSASP
jgi:hypothetical protein